MVVVVVEGPSVGINHARPSEGETYSWQPGQ